METHVEISRDYAHQEQKTLSRVSNLYEDITEAIEATVRRPD